jgi:cobalt/nickel transport system permease protein
VAPRAVARPAPEPRSPALNLDRYVDGSSVFHRADARLKFVLAVAAILALALQPVGSFAAFFLAWLVLVSASATAGLGPFRLSRAAIIALPFALAAFPLIFTRPEQPLGSFDLGPLTLTISGEGIRIFTSILVRSWLSVQVALLLAFTTPFHDLVDALRELRLPRIMIAIISFMYRYLAVLIDEATRMLRARDARSADPTGRGGVSIRWRASVTGRMVGSLFLRAYERSERIYAAMQARGFEGEFRHLGTRTMRRDEWTFFVGAMGVLVLYVVAGILWLPRL